MWFRQPSAQPSPKASAVATAAPDGYTIGIATSSTHPAAMVLHYGQAIFEGFKAYRQPDGSIASFRPDANAAPEKA